jgi:hypothetical protein
MARAPAKKTGQRAGRRREARAPVTSMMERGSRTGRFGADHDRFEIVMNAAKRSGLLKEKSSRIAGRISPALVRQAKKRTGIEADTDLIEFALANVALEDNFAEAFAEARGRVDGKLKLGF